MWFRAALAALTTPGALADASQRGVDGEIDGGIRGFPRRAVDTARIDVVWGEQCQWRRERSGALRERHGDVAGGPDFAHVSSDDFRIPRAILSEGRDATAPGRLVPYAVFIDPQLGRVGLSEAEARQRGLVRVATLPMRDVARAAEVDEPRGVRKVVVGADDTILGCAALGSEGGDFVARAQWARMGRLPYSALRDGISAHPTLAEAWNALLARIAA